MNDFGYFSYNDYPLNSSGTVTSCFDKQANTQDVQLIGDIVDNSYENFATFEPDGFDFRKHVFLNAANQKAACTSQLISDENGEFTVEGTRYELSFDVLPGGEYSGTGFSLFTYNSDYTVLITITDDDGTRGKTFERTEDEFYYFPYEGLTYVEFRFTRIEPNHFLKVLGYNFGTTRQITEADFADEPSITTHFSLTNEDLEYDVLELLLRGNKDNYIVTAGQKFIYSKTGQAFYVSDVQYNDDNSISITAYDDMFKLDNQQYMGRIPGTQYNAVDWLISILQGENNDITVENQSVLLAYINGTIGIMSRREAARILLRASLINLKRESGKMLLIDVGSYDETANPQVFDESNIEKVNSIEIYEQHKHITVTENTYAQQIAIAGYEDNPYEEVFDGVIAKGQSTTIYFDEPHSARKYYYVSGQTAQGDDILTPVMSEKFTVQSAGAYYTTVLNDALLGYTERIVITAIPYIRGEITYAVDIESRAPSWISEDISISDGTFNGTDGYANFLQYIYGMRYKVTFSSLKDCNSGDYARLTFDDKDIVGWITAKTEHLNGLYEYELYGNDWEE